MKQILIICALLLSIPVADLHAQKNSKVDKEVEAENADNQTEAEYKFNRNIFVQAMKYYDYGVATMALYNMMELRPSVTELKDTLALLYFNQGGHAQCKLVGEEILEEDPQNVTIREIVAISEQSLGMLKDALQEYEMLYRITGDIFHLYQIASLQFSLQRWGECNATIEKILNEPASSEKKININTGKEIAQEVPISAAALNMRGVIALEMNNKDDAMAHFNEALEIYPDFTLAKANIEKLKSDEND